MFEGSLGKSFERPHFNQKAGYSSACLSSQVSRRLMIQNILGIIVRPYLKNNHSNKE
jgi:hypothetical protein